MKTTITLLNKTFTVSEKLVKEKAIKLFEDVSTAAEQISEITNA